MKGNEHVLNVQHLNDMRKIEKMKNATNERVIVEHESMNC